VHALLLPQSLARGEAVEHCRRYLATKLRWPRLTFAALPREHRDDWVTLLAWNALQREISGLPNGFERRRAWQELAAELDAALEEHPRSALGLALSFSIRRHALPEELLRRPLQEWERADMLSTFESREALLGHARALAAPLGRMFLRVSGRANPRNEALTDALAVALQLTEWLTHLPRDLERGRVRLPLEELTRAGGDLSALFARRPSPEIRAWLAQEAARIRVFYARGWELCRELGPWNGRRLAFVLRWHAASLSALEAAGPRLLARPLPSGRLRMLACATASLFSRRPPRFE
jgi:phytoene/squalene synthetase